MAKKKVDLAGALAEAAKADGWMVAVWTLKRKRVRLHRVTDRFPVVDFQTALDLLEGDIGRIVAPGVGQAKLKRGEPAG